MFSSHLLYIFLSILFFPHKSAKLHYIINIMWFYSFTIADKGDRWSTYLLTTFS